MAEAVATSCPITKDAVRALFNRYISAILPKGFSGGFCLAGGGYKSLIHGRPPKDLDLWPASEDGREKLLSALQGQCATLLEHREFNSLLTHPAIDPTKIEVTRRCPDGVYDCIRNFDLVLSCVGVEYSDGEIERVYIHKGIPEAIKKREITLVPRVDAMIYRLGTLRRLREYSKELGYTLPPKAIDQIWNIYAGQSEEYRASMLRAVGMCPDDVPENYRVVREFVDGRPPEKCRMFHENELEALKQYLTSASAVKRSQGEGPMAIYLVGPPGSGKTALFPELLQELELPPEASFVNMDMDIIRSFHQHFQKYLEGEVMGSQRRRIYKDLVEWFNESSNIEEILYKNPYRLFKKLVLDKRSNFVVHMCSEDLVHFLRKHHYKYGYKPVIINFLAIPADRERRATALARRTGRFSTEDQMVKVFSLEHLHNIKNEVRAMGGRVFLINNDNDGGGGVPVCVPEVTKI